MEFDDQPVCSEEDLAVMDWPAPAGELEAAACATRLREQAGAGCVPPESADFSPPAGYVEPRHKRVRLTDLADAGDDSPSGRQVRPVDQLPQSVGLASRSIDRSIDRPTDWPQPIRQAGQACRPATAQHASLNGLVANKFSDRVLARPFVHTGRAMERAAFLRWIGSTTEPEQVHFVSGASHLALLRGPRGSRITVWGESFHCRATECFDCDAHPHCHRVTDLIAGAGATVVLSEWSQGDFADPNHRSPMTMAAARWATTVADGPGGQRIPLFGNSPDVAYVNVDPRVVFGAEPQEEMPPLEQLRAMGLRGATAALVALGARLYRRWLANHELQPDDITAELAAAYEWNRARFTRLHTLIVQALRWDIGRAALFVDALTAPLLDVAVARAVGLYDGWRPTIHVLVGADHVPGILAAMGHAAVQRSDVASACIDARSWTFVPQTHGECAVARWERAWDLTQCLETRWSPLAPDDPNRGRGRVERGGRSQLVDVDDPRLDAMRAVAEAWLLRRTCGAALLPTECSPAGEGVVRLAFSAPLTPVVGVSERASDALDLVKAVRELHAEGVAVNNLERAVQFSTDRGPRVRLDWARVSDDHGTRADLESLAAFVERSGKGLANAAELVRMGALEAAADLVVDFDI